MASPPDLGEGVANTTIPFREVKRSAGRCRIGGEPGLRRQSSRGAGRDFFPLPLNKLPMLRESQGVRATCQETAVVDSVSRRMTGWLWGAFAAARERAESDADLLGRFVRTRDEAAFRELVRRLGPTVFGVCRRHLGNTADADDAFQTTFLVLARKAGTVHPPWRVAAWVYGVASLAARKLRQARWRRQLREVAVPHLPDRPASEGEMDAELRPAVDEELGRLPDSFRLPIVLCGLRG